MAFLTCKQLCKIKELLANLNALIVLVLKLTFVKKKLKTMRNADHADANLNSDPEFLRTVWNNF
jgi:hypothetical protein